MQSSTTFPSATSWITPRTEDVRLTTSNCVIVLNKAISEVKQLLLKPYADTKMNRLPIQHLGTETTTTTLTINNKHLSDLFLDSACTQPIESLDVTRYIVEQAKYKTLDVPGLFQTVDFGGLYTICVFYYIYSEKTIYLSNHESGMETQEIVYRFALYDLVSKVGRVYTKDSLNNVYYILPTWINTLNATYSLSGFSSMNNLFRVRYTPLGESVKLNVPKTEPVGREFTIPFSQQQQVVSAQALGRNMQATANRMGVPTRQVIRRYDSMKYFRPLGTIWREKDAQGNPTGNIWKLVAEDLHYQLGWITATELWAKNWSLQSEYVGVNRQFRSWKIPADTVQRDLHTEDYVYLTTDETFRSSADVLLSDGAKEEILRSLQTSHRTEYGAAVQTECECMWFVNPSQNRKGVVLSSSAFAFGNSLVFSGKTKDNLSAGIQRDSADSQYCKDVYYCNDDGRIRYMGIIIGTEIGHANANAYPASLHEQVNPDNNVNDPQGFTLFANQYTRLVDKDPSEQLNFTYQVHFVTHEADLVIGAAWAANCPLIKQRNEDVTLKYWNITRPIPKGIQTMTATYGTVNAASVITFGKENGKDYFNIAAQSAVTDANDNIIVANNGVANKKVYLVYVSAPEYPRIQKVYYDKHKYDYTDATVPSGGGVPAETMAKIKAQAKATQDAFWKMVGWRPNNNLK